MLSSTQDLRPQGVTTGDDHRPPAHRDLATDLARSGSQRWKHSQGTVCTEPSVRAGKGGDKLPPAQSVNSRSGCRGIFSSLVSKQPSVIFIRHFYSHSHLTYIWLFNAESLKGSQPRDNSLVRFCGSRGAALLAGSCAAGALHSSRSH